MKSQPTIVEVVKTLFWQPKLKTEHKERYSIDVKLQVELKIVEGKINTDDNLSVTEVGQLHFLLAVRESLVLHVQQQPLIAVERHSLNFSLVFSRLIPSWQYLVKLPLCFCFPVALPLWMSNRQSCQHLYQAGSWGRRMERLGKEFHIKNMNLVEIMMSWSWC